MVGSEETNFDDSNFSKDKTRVSKVILYSGRILDALQFVYDDDKPAPHRGGDGGQISSLTLGPNEYIVEISGSTGKDPFASVSSTIGAMTITTNKGRSVSAGMGSGFSPQTPFSYKAAASKQIFALKGRYYLSGMDFFISSVEVARETDGVQLNFDDSDFARDKKRVSQISLRSGRLLDGLQFVYDDNKAASSHGGDGGHESTLALAPSEYIVEVSGSIGKDPFATQALTVGALTIKTNKGRSISAGMGSAFGPQTPFSYKADDGKQIFALKGQNYAAGKDCFISSLEVGMVKGVEKPL